MGLVLKWKTHYQIKVVKLNSTTIELVHIITWEKN